MIARFIEGLVRAKPLDEERGSALVELALCVPMLLILVFGLIDFSQVIFEYQVMTGLSRQGCNLASRGTTLVDTASALVIQGASLNIGTKGKIFVTAVAADASGVPRIVDQATSTTGISVTSRIGSGNGTVASMPAAANTVLKAGQTLYIVEIFCTYKPMTPIGGLLKTSLNSTLYDSAYF
jgi:Flp pilus assembly protein TadG